MLWLTQVAVITWVLPKDLLGHQFRLYVALVSFNNVLLALVSKSLRRRINKASVSL
jgi:hypothetical protein